MAEVVSLAPHVGPLPSPDLAHAGGLGRGEDGEEDALRGQDLTIYGDGTQTRSFCFVDDLVEGFVRFMATSDDVTGPINLGNTGEFTVAELAEKVIAKVGGPSRIVYRDLPSDDPKVRKPDITKARAVLGWEAKVALDEGLDKTIAYFAKVVTP